MTSSKEKMKDKSPESGNAKADRIATYDDYLSTFFQNRKETEPNFGKSLGKELAQFAIKQISKNSQAS